MTPDQAYAAAFAIVWRDENGSMSIVSSDNPKDPGGYTRGGIALNRHPELTRAKLEAMTFDDFYVWYRANYWTPAKCDQLPWPVSLIVFDSEVNSGSVGVRALQAALGLKQDGVIGPVTLAAVARAEPVALAAKVCVKRDDFYHALSNFSTFGVGWLTRIFGNMYAAGKSAS